MQTRTFAIAVAGLVLGSTASVSQTTTTTTCQSNTPNSVNCQSQTTPDLSAQIQAQNEATARNWSQFFAALQARRDRNAAAAQQQQANQALAAERQAMLSAELQRQAVATTRENARDKESRTAEDERRQARLELFMQRADFIRQEILKRNPITMRSRSDYMSETGDVLSKLFIANPLASNAEIKEALGPLNAKFIEGVSRSSATTKFADDVSRSSVPDLKSMQEFRAAVMSSLAAYKIPHRDFERFRSDAWDAVAGLEKSELLTSSFKVREVVDMIAQNFVTSPEPPSKTR